ncbi:deoxyribodipyrimidine photo-lyase [Bryobacterales bacterium F-183]|nr:deoxyribodipyrimidine photo-lyase [Bryobacterales bacterium F-183]
MDVRVRNLNGLTLGKGKHKPEYVLYWAQMNRRVEQNHALAYAISLANQLDLPVLMYEALGNTYPQANDRIHTFVVEAVPETERRAKALGLGYVFYLRKRKSDPNDVFYNLAAKAAAIVTDDYPSFIAVWHNASVPKKVDIPYFAVDASCVVPMNLFEKREYGAYTIRPKIQKILGKHLRPVEMERVKVPWGNRAIPAFHTQVTPENVGQLVSECDIDHSVAPSTDYRGGRLVVEQQLQHFLKANLARYDKDRNDPSSHATSDMSPYLHFGQISALELALAVQDYAADHNIDATAYLEELIVRRELAFNFARFTSDLPNHGGLSVLPEWAQKTLAKHDPDKRDAIYTLHEFETARTHDALWNAAQKEMLLRGKIHGYYRMYWGKKIIEWSKTHEEAFATMVHLHDRYALDGRDPNTYTNILWCFGLHDRPWTERPIFGMIRWMSLEGMKRKTGVDAYIREIAYLENQQQKQKMKKVTA